MPAEIPNVERILKHLTSLYDAGQTIEINEPPYLIHIDRQLPYLIIYRSTDDGLATLDIFNAFSSYIILPADNKFLASSKAIIDGIVKLHQKYFNGSLLIEMWTKSATRTALNQGEANAQNFTLYLPAHGLSNATTETLEQELQKITLGKTPATLKVNYGMAITPSSMKKLYDNEISEPNSKFIGIELDESYQNRELKEAYPFVIKKLKSGLNHAIKKVVYTFAHENTLFKPSHFHVLGKQFITDITWQCDKALTDINESFDLLLHVTPVNASEAWHEFKANHYNIVPEFHYRPRKVDPYLLKRELYKTPVEGIEDPALNDLFTSKRNELDEQIGLLNKRESSQFLYSSIQLFGTIDEELLNIAKNLLLNKPVTENEPDKILLDAHAFVKEADKVLDYYRSIDPTLKSTVKLDESITGILVSHGHFLVGTDARVAPSRMRATLSHEIGTHVLTYHNGTKQSFGQFYSGMAGYEELQEGLAVLGEYLSDGLTYDRLTILAARVIAVDSIIQGADFIETFNLLRCEYGLYPHTAFYTTMRVYRGGGYTKDMIYLRGLIRLLSLIASGFEFKILFTGKIAFDFLDIVEELYWRNIIKEAAILPKYMQSDTFESKLAIIKESPTLDTLLESCK